MVRFLRVLRGLLILSSLALPTARQAHSQSRSALAIGEEAPPLSLAKIQERSTELTADWNTLKGEVVVLEFWASWCPPCLATIPHLNDLAETFSGQPVRFLSITSEKSDVVQAFLQKKPVGGWIGFDQDGSTARAYKVHFVPHAVIVDQRGRIAAITDPILITAAVLNRILKGEPSGLPLLDYGEITNSEAEPGQDYEAAQPVFQIDVRPVTSTAGLVKIGRSDGTFTARGETPGNLLGILYEFPSDRIQPQELLPTQRYSVVAAMPPGRQALLFPLLKEAFLAAFEVELQPEKREMDVWVLTAPNARGGSLLAQSNATTLHVSSGPGFYAATGSAMSFLAGMLESKLRRPVMNDTSLEGAYDWELDFDEGNEQSLKQAVQHLGLEIIPGKREIDVLTVHRASH